MEENLNINELIKIETMPKVFEQLELIGKWVDDNLAKLDIANLEITEENKQEIKKIRTEINNTTKELEDRRKFIKEKILEPYNQFNEKYENEIKNKLLNASETLREKINDIEIEQKARKENALREFFNEYAENLHITSVISYENLNLNVTLSASEKSLKEAIKNKLESVSNDIALISLEEYKDEILLEYEKNGFNFAGAKLLVVERKKKIMEMELERQQREQQIQEEEKIENVVEEVIEEITAPVEEEVPTPEINENQMMIYTFTVTGTKEQIISVRDFMKENGISYE